MSQFWLYFQLGYHYVLDWQTGQPILFLLVLIAAYSFQELRKIGLLILIFALGFIVSLLLTSFDVILVKTEIVKFLIPLGILLLALYNLATAEERSKPNKIQGLYFTTIFFGLIFGLGFSRYFATMTGNTTPKIAFLLEFALGIETAIILVVFGILILSFIFQNLFRYSRRDWILVISSIVIGFAIPMLVKNVFW